MFVESISTAGKKIREGKSAIYNVHSLFYTIIFSLKKGGKTPFFNPFLKVGLF